MNVVLMYIGIALTIAILIILISRSKKFWFTAKIPSLKSFPKPSKESWETITTLIIVVGVIICVRSITHSQPTISKEERLSKEILERLPAGSHVVTADERYRRLGYGNYDMLPTDTVLVDWGSMSGAFYPLNQNSAFTVRLFRMNDMTKHCDIKMEHIIENGVEGFRPTILESTAHNTDGNFPDDVYLAVFCQTKTITPFQYSKDRTYF